MIIIFLAFQIILTIIGVNIYNRRIHFESKHCWRDRFDLQCGRIDPADLVCPSDVVERIYMVHMGIPDVLLWLVRLYPFCNELMGLISVICHNKKLVFEKYRQDE
jgi:hypothetical protein